MQVGENIVASSESQNENCDAATAFNTAVELFSETTKNSVNESDGSPVFSSGNTDKLNIPTHEETDHGSVDMDQHVVPSEDSHALQSAQSLVECSEVNIHDDSRNTGDSRNVTNDSSLKESDGNSSEYTTTDISLQYFTDEGK